MKSPTTAPDIGTLADELLLHKKLYYAGKARISDEAYDALEAKLREIDPHHPVLEFVGAAATDGESSSGKVSHHPPMLSLLKTYEPADLHGFLAQGDCICCDKIDGMAMSLEYDMRGFLHRASTRGNGRVGENATDHIFQMPDVPKVLRLPDRIKGLELEVRGEVFFPHAAFEQFEDQFDSYRNAVPGTFGRKEVDEAIPVLRVLKFHAYDCLLKDPSQGRLLSVRETYEALGLEGSSFFARMEFLERNGFNPGVREGALRRISRADAKNLESAEELERFIKDWFARSRDYQIDGIVFRLDDDVRWEDLGATAHHPRGSLAFKQTGDVKTTRIVAIEEAIGRSGKITFRAKLEPVFLSGAEISYATLHNAEFVETGGYAPGAVVSIKRSGEVIPSIIGLVEKSTDEYRIPTTCPCGFPAERIGPELFCAVKTPCPRRDQESLVHFVKAMGVLGVSDKILLKMRNAGLVSEPADLFRVTAHDLLQLDGFGEKSAENVEHAFQSKRKVALSVFLTALGLRRGGVVKCQDVARRFRTLEAVRQALPADLMAERGWADRSAEEFLNSLKDKSLMIDALIQVIEVEPEPEITRGDAVDEGHELFGKNICITGTLSRPRGEYKPLIENVGGKLVDSVSSTTNVLVSNDASGSSKYKQAVKLGIPIIDENALIEKLGEKLGN